VAYEQRRPNCALKKRGVAFLHFLRNLLVLTFFMI